MSELLKNNLNSTITSADLVSTPLPMCPDISLFLVSPDYPKGKLPDEEMLAIIKRPAYWAFCWASGQVLAAYLMSNPQICRGKTVLDFGAGSGVNAIAAKLSGAFSAIACDLDEHALTACAVNGDLNGVKLDMIKSLNSCKKKVDLLIASDVLYDRDNIRWLERMGNYTNEVIIADSRIRDKEVFKGFQKIQSINATTIPDLDETREFGEVTIYRKKYR